MEAAAPGVTVFRLDSFTMEGRGGNPAGVVLPSDAERLDATQMQAVAAEVGLSETAFVSNLHEEGNGPNFEVRFFTPTVEVDFCGHATLATACLLGLKGHLPRGTYVQSTKAGLFPVTINEGPNARTLMKQQPPVFYDTGLELGQVAAALGVDASSIAGTGFKIQAVSTGLPVAVVPLTGGVDSLEPVMDLVEQVAEQAGKAAGVKVAGLYVFEVTRTSGKGCETNGRFFGPGVGIPEDPATGSASGAVACYLFAHHPSSPTDFTLQQGKAMGRCSQVLATIEPHQSTPTTVAAINVGGVATLAATTTVSLK